MHDCVLIHSHNHTVANDAGYLLESIKIRVLKRWDHRLNDSAFLGRGVRFSHSPGGPAPRFLCSPCWVFPLLVPI